MEKLVCRSLSKVRFHDLMILTWHECNKSKGNVIQDLFFLVIVDRGTEAGIWSILADSGGKI